MGLGQSAIIKKDKTAPYDISVEYYYFGDSTDDEMNGMSVLEKLEQQGAALPQYLESSADLTMYEQENLTESSLFAICTENTKVRRNFEDPPVLLLGADAVSYTHLDVYKRQEVDRRWERLKARAEHPLL